jgi:hypothetical protein
MRFSPLVPALLAGALSLCLLTRAACAQERKPPTHTHGHDAAFADVQKMTTANGLEVGLFASEPMLVNPADIDVDAQGRVWSA